MIFCSSVVGIILLIYLLVQIPYFQTRFARMAAGFLSKQLNTTITIDHLQILGFRKIGLEGFLVRDQKGDTLLYSESLNTHVKKLKISQPLIKLKSLQLRKACFYLKNYKEDSVTNLQFLIDYLRGSPDTIKDTISSFGFYCKNVNLTDLRFRYVNEKRLTEKRGINFFDLDISGINLIAEDVTVENDTVNAKIGLLQAREKSGFNLLGFMGQVKMTSKGIFSENLKIETNRSKLDLDVAFFYNSFHSFSDFVNLVNIESEIRNSSLDLSEIGYFAPELFTMKDQVGFSGKVTGTVSNLQTKEFKIDYGQSSRFRGKIKMNGLPNIKETFIHFVADELSITVADIEKFQLPGNPGKINIPQELAKFGKIRINGKFTGFYNDFVSYSSFQTDVGRFSTDLILKPNQENNIVYRGAVNAQNFDAGRMFNVSGFLGKMNFVADIEGEGLDLESASVSFFSMVDSLELSGNEYNSVVLSGEFKNKAFEGNIHVYDDNINLDFDGLIDFGSSVPKYKFNAKIKDAALYTLNLSDRDSTMSLSTNLDINFMGTRP
ncbi:MAG: hypothetical protein K8R53_10375, partial [Bacteroidales bacterium]|nr:hypothetical protein [Bacteroidales bacterium]